MELTVASRFMCTPFGLSAGITSSDSARMGMLLEIPLRRTVKIWNIQAGRVDIANAGMGDTITQTRAKAQGRSAHGEGTEKHGPQFQANFNHLNESGLLASPGTGREPAQDELLHQGVDGADAGCDQETLDHS